MVLRMPRDLVARAQMLAQGGPWEPPAAVDAATVVLLRDGAAGLEVLLMRRPDSMAFAPGMNVFPGGRVDLAQDGDVAVSGTLRAGPGADPAVARALIVAGVRETFEEAGVLLATDDSGRPPVPDHEWAQDRRDSESAAAFPALLERRRLTIQTAHLVPVAHWITPEVETRRFDTRFMLAVLPEGQEVEAHTTETDSAQWVVPAQALDQYRSGHLPMLPPTVAVLDDLTAAGSVDEALIWARTRDVLPLMPRAQLSGDDLHWVLVHGYTGAVLAVADEPSGSEERGNR